MKIISTERNIMDFKFLKVENKGLKSRFKWDKFFIGLKQNWKPLTSPVKERSLLD